MDLDKVKILMRLGSDYEGAYGVCLRELTKIEGQLPPHKSPRPRAESAKMGAVRYTDGLCASGKRYRSGT